MLSFYSHSTVKELTLFFYCGFHEGWCRPWGFSKITCRQRLVIAHMERHHSGKRLFCVSWPTAHHVFSAIVNWVLISLWNFDNGIGWWCLGCWILQLNVLRHFLGEGFQRHMQVGTSQIHFFWQTPIRHTVAHHTHHMDLGLEMNGCPWKKKHRRARKYGPTNVFLSVVVWSRRTHYCMRYLTLYHKLRKTHLARNKRYCHKQQNCIPLFHPKSREFPSLDTDSLSRFQDCQTEFSCCCRGCSCHQIQLWARHAHKWWIAVAHIHRWFLSLLLLLLLLLTSSFSFSSFLNCIFLPSRLLLCQDLPSLWKGCNKTWTIPSLLQFLWTHFSAMGCLLKKRKPSLVSISKCCQKTDSIFFLNDWLFLWCPCSFSDDFFFFFFDVRMFLLTTLAFVTCAGR